MKLTVLVDNKENDAKKLRGEHGLSFFLQADDKNYLVDVGTTSLFIENANMLGIDIADTDYLILSHAHADHVGGLAAFLEINNKAKIYLSSNVCERNCFSTRHGFKRNISIDHKLLQLHKERFIFVEKNVAITENVKLISEIPHVFPMPKANATLLANDIQDDFSHELAILVKSCNGATIISPCTHRGILNILETVKNYKVINFIGGLHLLDSDEKNSYESEEEIIFFARKISKRNISISTGHCTGNTAKDIFLRELGERFTEFYSGYTMSI